MADHQRIENWIKFYTLPVQLRNLTFKVNSLREVLNSWFAWSRLLSVLSPREGESLSYKIWCHRKLCNLHKTYPMDKSLMDQDRKNWQEDIQVKTTK